MAGSRCGCSQDRCGCVIVAGPNIKVTGNGTKSNPTVVEAVIPDVVVDPGGGGGGGGTVVVGRFPGEVTMYAGGAIPSGWLPCNGAAVSRTVYADLFAVLGVTWGAGNGTTTFNVPPSADRFPIGSSGSRPVGTRGGQFDYSISVGQMPAHSHGYNHTHRIDHNHPDWVTSAGEGAHGHSEPRFNSGSDGTSHTTFRWGSGNTVANIVDGQHQHTIATPGISAESFGVAQGENMSQTGGSQPLSVVPPNAAFTFLIKT